MRVNGRCPHPGRAPARAGEAARRPPPQIPQMHDVVTTAQFAALLDVDDSPRQLRG
jgi:hypothetical protein